MSSEVFERLDIHPIINAVGYATRVSGSCPHPSVVAAMSAASGAYFEVDDLLMAANSQIQRATGAEAGIVTCGAAAALSLAAAACLAGNRPEIMDRLPDVSDLPRNEFIFPAPGPFDYDHAVRVSGAKLKTIDYHAPDAMERIEKAITSKTAAICYVWLQVEEHPPIAALAETAHRHGLPLIVDAACALPPMENLKAFSRMGADLIAYSGGKHLGGPQASGILCGREELVRSAWVQMADMDVRDGTWSLQHWVANGWIRRPPRHGIGRTMKVSKESIVGLMAALGRYSTRDHAAEQASWAAVIDEIEAGLRDLNAFRITRRPCGLSGQPFPNLQIESGSEPGGMSVRDLIHALRNRPRGIILAEDERSPDRAFIYSTCLKPEDAAEIVSAVRQAVSAHQGRKTP